ncbi:hypothetical protein KM043_015166 [Ampulex compressa]|nr:hypothetical protein KM043_015166 [Ampulex compressa]
MFTCHVRMLLRSRPSFGEREFRFDRPPSTNFTSSLRLCKRKIASRPRRNILLIWRNDERSGFEAVLKKKKNRDVG